MSEILSRILCWFGCHDWYHHHALFEKTLCFKVCAICEKVEFYWAPKCLQPKSNTATTPRDGETR